MIEVVVAALLVALIAGGVLTGFGQVSSLSSGQRQRAQATALAQQDQARLRGLSITQLSGTAGNGTAPGVPLDGTTFYVTSKSTYVTGTGGATCVAGQTGTTADEIAISSSVTWSNIGPRPPVVLHSVVTPPVGGSVVVSGTTPSTTGGTGSSGLVGLAGMTATLTGPTTTIPVTTDSTGCAIFGGLSAGSYTLSVVPPAGYIDVNGNTTIPGQTPVVTATQTNYITTPTIPTMAQPGTITASFSTVGATGATAIASEADQFSITNQAITAGSRVFGTDSTATNNAYATTVSSGATVYPTATLSSQYKAEAGGCVVPNATQIPVTVTSGQTATPTLPEPALIILPYTSPATPTGPTTFDDTQAASGTAPQNYGIVYSPAANWVANTNTGKDFGNKEHDDATATNTATFTFYGTGVAWIGTKAKGNGIAAVTLDNVSQGTFDEGQSSNTPVYQQTIHTWSGLTLGSHTLTITVNGSHSLGTGNNVSIDEFTYTSLTPAVLMTTQPHVVVTDTDSVCGGNSDYPPTVSNPSTSSTGALQFPGLPYGTYTVCVDNGTTGAAVHDTVTGVNNYSYTSGNPLPAGNLPVTLYSGGVGTYGTGPCQTTPTAY